MIYYSHTPEGQFNLLIKNTKSQIEHIAKQRELCVTKEEMKSWFVDHPKINREAYFVGIDFIYNNPDVTPKVAAQAVVDKIKARKKYWLNKIKQNSEK